MKLIVFTPKAMHVLEWLKLGNLHKQSLRSNDMQAAGHHYTLKQDKSIKIQLSSENLTDTHYSCGNSLVNS